MNFKCKLVRRNKKRPLYILIKRNLGRNMIIVIISAQCWCFWIYKTKTKRHKSKRSERSWYNNDWKIALMVPSLCLLNYSFIYVVYECVYMEMFVCMYANECVGVHTHICMHLKGIFVKIKIQSYQQQSYTCFCEEIAFSFLR